MNQRCPVGGEVFGPDEAFCPVHIVDLVPDLPPPPEPPPPTSTPPTPTPPVDRVAWTPDVCWNCRTPSPNPANSECLSPDCRRSLVPPALLIRFRDGQVEVEAGSRVQLGRLGEHARLFRSFDNVSRRHAIVGVEPGGRAWIEPLPTPNGTFLNGNELDVALQSNLRSGDTVRLARNAEGAVTLYAIGGEPA